MEAHEKYLRDNGFGYLLDSKTEFMKSCDCDGYNIEDVCKPERCRHYEECMEFRKPLTEFLEKNCEA